jgi:hypothetical protein
MPRRRRVGEDPSIRTIRVGRVLWRARLAQPDEEPDAPVDGHECVCLEGANGQRYFAIVGAGEFERLSNYRLRSLIMGPARESGLAEEVRRRPSR